VETVERGEIQNDNPRGQYPSRRRSIDQSKKGKRKREFRESEQREGSTHTSRKGTRRSTDSWISRNTWNHRVSLLFEVKPVIWFWRRMSMDKGALQAVDSILGISQDLDTRLWDSVMQERERMYSPPFLKC
jgi:hypothetical protein